MSTIDNMIMERREFDGFKMQGNIAYFDYCNDKYYAIIDYSKMKDSDYPKFNIKFKSSEMAKLFYDKNHFWYAKPNITLKDDVIEIEKPKDGGFLVKICCFENMQYAYKLITSIRMQYKNYVDERLNRVLK